MNDGVKMEEWGEAWGIKGTNIKFLENLIPFEPVDKNSINVLKYVFMKAKVTPIKELVLIWGCVCKNLGIE